MKVNETTRRNFRLRRFKRQAIKDGFEPYPGDVAWRLDRGGRWREHIVEARVDPLGYGVWVRCAEDLSRLRAY